MIICRSHNWFEAKAYCHEIGGYLGKLDSNEKILDIISVIVERKLYKTCGLLYIGLRQEDWWIEHNPDYG